MTASLWGYSSVVVSSSTIGSVSAMSRKSSIGLRSSKFPLRFTWVKTLKRFKKSLVLRVSQVAIGFPSISVIWIPNIFGWWSCNFARASLLMSIHINSWGLTR